MVPEVGVEPTRPEGRGILSPLRLPFRHSGAGDAILAHGPALEANARTDGSG